MAPFHVKLVNDHETNLSYKSGRFVYLVGCPIEDMPTIHITFMLLQEINSNRLNIYLITIYDFLVILVISKMFF